MILAAAVRRERAKGGARLQGPEPRLIERLEGRRRLNNLIDATTLSSQKTALAAVMGRPLLFRRLGALSGLKRQRREHQGQDLVTGPS